MNLLKHGLRQFALRPGFSVIVVLMLALGIGATTAMFSLYHQVLLRPLPVPEPERLVNFAAPGPRPGGEIRDLAIGDSSAKFSYPMFRDLEREQGSFTGLAAYVDFLANLTFDDRPMAGRGILVSGSYFNVLGLRPALGRLIGPGDDPRVGESAVAVLSHEYWQTQLGGDPGVIGQTLAVNGQMLEIVGVAPAGFTGTTLGLRPQIFVPLTLTLMRPTPEHEDRQLYWLYLFGRLAPGMTMERAAAEINVLYGGILNEVEAPLLSASQLPAGAIEQFRQLRVTLSPGARGKSPLPDRAGRPLVLLLGVTVLVLLIVCVNLANLLLARGASRAGEMAIRASLGASRIQLVRQLLAESFVLIAIGGVASLVVAALVVRLITAFLPAGVAAGLAPELSSAALMFAAGISLVTVLAFGLVPAWRVSGMDAAAAMKAHAARSSGGRAAVRFRATLTTAQIAFSMVLLVLAGLFTRSLMNVGRENLGMDADAIATFSITPRLNAYDPERLALLYDRVEEELAAEPGVAAVGSAWLPLLSSFSIGAPISVAGVEAAPGADAGATMQLISPGYFDALGVSLLAGRAFTDSDTADAVPVAIVNEAFVRRRNLGDPVGRRLGFAGSPEFPFEIVGVVADAKHDSVKGEVQPIVYAPRRQNAGAIESMFYYVRSSLNPEALLTAIPRVVAGIDADVPVTNLRTMRSLINDSVYIDRLLSMLSMAFAALATLLAGVGIFGVLAYNVTQRTRELGLRLALGADPARLRAMILKQVGAMAGIGAGIGLVAALGLGRVAAALLFGLSGRDPAVVVSATAVLAAVVLAAAWIPARRAARTAPTDALRYD